MIIIAILAALILPRITSQTNKAIVAEGLQMVGAFRREAERTAALDGSYEGFIQHWPPDPYFTVGDWSTIGLKDVDHQKNGGYQYEGLGTSYSITAWMMPDSQTFLIYAYDSASPQAVSKWTGNGLLTNDNDESKPCRLA